MSGDPGGASGGNSSGGDPGVRRGGVPGGRDRRRLTLAPGAFGGLPVSSSSGSRFDVLRDGDLSDSGSESNLERTATSVAAAVLEEARVVSSSDIQRPPVASDVLAREFWSEAGFPRPESCY